MHCTPLTTLGPGKCPQTLVGCMHCGRKERDPGFLAFDGPFPYPPTTTAPHSPTHTFECQPFQTQYNNIRHPTPNLVTRFSSLIDSPSFLHFFTCHAVPHISIHRLSTRLPTTAPSSDQSYTKKRRNIHQYYALVDGRLWCSPDAPTRTTRIDSTIRRPG